MTTRRIGERRLGRAGIRLRRRGDGLSVVYDQERRGGEIVHDGRGLLVQKREEVLDAVEITVQVQRLVGVLGRLPTEAVAYRVYGAGDARGRKHNLPRRIKLEPAQLLRPALARDVESTYGLDGVAEELDARRRGAAGGEYVDYGAAARELGRPLDHADALVAEAGQIRLQLRRLERIADAEAPHGLPELERRRQPARERRRRRHAPGPRPAERKEGPDPGRRRFQARRDGLERHDVEGLEQHHVFARVTGDVGGESFRFVGHGHKHEHRRLELPAQRGHE